MKSKHRLRIWAIISVLCAAMILTLMPVMTFAETPGTGNEQTVIPESLEMTAGDVLPGFSILTSSSDPKVAWVDEKGKLNALKAGETDLRFIDMEAPGDIGTCHVTVKPYIDDSGVVGNLKVLARYNDSMQFYDGHSYLIFTSYQDGVTIEVPDLYRGYEISKDYYYDIQDNIAAGSNHTGGDPEEYFTLRDDMQSMTLDRGQVVTIGMYRGFELSIEDAVKETLKNSTVWTEIAKAGKTVAAETIINLLVKREISVDGALERLKELLSQIGVKDFSKWLDGKTNGGVCFNRELYNQKLEWDQFENITYDLDITENQLRRLEAALPGNLNQFSIFNNSCATIVQKAWNAAVGTTPEGEPNAYYLNVKGNGIYAIMDAPKGARDAIRSRLKGAVVNNSKGGDPECGFEDETGWVYVTAPKKLDPEPAPVPTEYRIRTLVKMPEDVTANTFVYYKDGGDPVELAPTATLAPGTPIYVKYTIDRSKTQAILKDITLNGESILGSYDPEEEAYCAEMPNSNSKLRITFASVVMEPKSDDLQLGIGELLRLEDAFDVTIDGKEADPKQLRWIMGFEADPELYREPEQKCLAYADETKQTLTAIAEGGGMVGICLVGQEEVRSGFYTMLTYDPETTAKINCSEDIFFACTKEGETKYVGNQERVEVGSTLRAIVEEDNSSRVISKLTCNGKPVRAGEAVEVTGGDLNFDVEFRTAEVTMSDKWIHLMEKGDTAKLSAKVNYTGILARLQKVYDSRIHWASSNPSLVEVDQNGRVTLVGDVPADGAKVLITARAGSSCKGVQKQCEVEIGNYKGNEIVGRLTIAARPIVKKRFVGHSFVTFMPYKDMNLDVSYFRYYDPNEKFDALLEDDRDHPNEYASDPVLYSEDIDLGERSTYFNIKNGSAYADTAPISLKSGEAVSFSDYSFGISDMENLIVSMENSEVYEHAEDMQAVVAQLKQYLEDGTYDAVSLFDNLKRVIGGAWMSSWFGGDNPMDGESNGGLSVNREIYNQFCYTDSMMPNQYYTIDITADELEQMKAFLADRENNYYAVITNNCSALVVDLWNAAMSDKPELQLTGNYSRFFAEPESLCIDIARLRIIPGLEGANGHDFYPRSYVNRHEISITSEDNELTASCVNSDREHFYGNCEKAEPVTLVLQATGTRYKDLSLENLEAFNELTGLNVAANEEYVKFYRVEDGNLVLVSEGAEEDGRYYAALTVEGESAGVFFTIKNGEALLGEDDPDEDPAVIVRMKNQTALNKGCGIAVSKSRAVSLKWGTVSGAAGYDVFVKKGNGTGLFLSKPINVKAGRKTALILTKVCGKKINTKKKYSFAVKAYKMIAGKKVYLATSKVYSANGPKNEKYTNVKKVIANPSAVYLKRGKTARIGTTLRKQTARKNLDKAAKKVYFFSNDPTVASVSSKGVIIGLHSGYCTIFCIAADGVKTSVKVTVK